MLIAGAGRSDITPPVGIAHAGWGAATHQRAEGVDMPFYATALYVTDGKLEIAIVDLDVGILTNKNALPFDPRPPRVTSGLRLGTPAITSRGMKEPEVKRIAAMLIKVLSDLEDKEAHINVAVEVKSLTSQFSVPGIDN